MSYVNQIDSAISKILDRLHIEIFTKKNVFKTIIDEKKINFVERQEEINNFIKTFIDNLDIKELQKLINNKEKLQTTLNIIKRYVAYYCFLYLAYFYAGTIKDYRNNLIQLSKAQETSSFNIKNFYDTENNYQLTVFFKIITDSKKILLMTPLQRKTLNNSENKEAIDFLKGFDPEYIDKFILEIINTKTDQTVGINVHNLLKIIVLQEIYIKQDQKTVYKILSDIEETENEYIWIDIVVSGDEYNDFNFFQNMFAGRKHSDFLARELFELTNKPETIDINKLDIDKKNNNLISFNKIITPIVDDFLRYHKDSITLENEQDKTFVLSHASKNNETNVQLALIRQHKKKKENTQAQLIVNKIDIISELYSENTKTNPSLEKEIKNLFYGPLAYRKAVLYNYNDEVFVMKKMQSHDRKVIEKDEYYLELKYINANAYFNFKDFQKYGTSLLLSNSEAINLLRYANIEFISQHPQSFIDSRIGISDMMINMTGLLLGPFTHIPLQCNRKEDMINIRNVKIIYPSTEGTKELQTNNGYDAFLKIIQYYFVKTIMLKIHPKIDLYNNYDSINKINPIIANKIIYWIYDTELDTYDITTYENIKTYDFQENIKYMNSKLYDEIMEMLFKQLVFIIRNNLNLTQYQIEQIVYLFVRKYELIMSETEIIELISREYLTKKATEQVTISEIKNSIKLINYEDGITNIPSKFYTMKINMLNFTDIQEYRKLESYLVKKEETTSDVVPTPKVLAKCRHESDWSATSKLRRVNLNEYNIAITQFMNKYAIETSELYFVCRLCSQFLPMKEFVQDGKFNNATQKYTTNYIPTNIPLNEIKEYTKYSKVIKYLDQMIQKISQITGTNMLLETTPIAKINHKTVVKNTLDIILKHNATNMGKDNSEQNFGVDKNISNVFYFELSDNIFDTVNNRPEEADINKIKLNNITLYLFWMFITELNPAQILGMTTDKISNIYVVEKYGDKIFEGLFLKKHVNAQDKIKLTEYPVLCYVLYLISYALVKYGRWYSLKTAKGFNIHDIKQIVHSMVELFNGFSINSNKEPNDYIYSLITSKIYTQLNSTLKNTDIIRLLKEKQIKYSGIAPKDIPVRSKFILHLSNFVSYRRYTYKVTTGIFYHNMKELSWHYTLTNTNLSNCPTGDYHNWETKGMHAVCKKCGENSDNLLDGDALTKNLIDRTNESYYFALGKIAKRKCANCKTEQDNLGDINEKNICTICNHAKSGKLSDADLDKINTGLEKINDEKYIVGLNAETLIDDEIILEEKMSELALDEIKKEFDKKILSTFINQLITLLGKETNFGTDALPVYLRDDVYIINHTYNGVKLDHTITFTETENKIIFKENHPFFGMDVFYYINNESGSIDVFYNAVTLKLIGYKEKHKEHVKVNTGNNYLIINRSIKNKLLTIGHKVRYEDVSKYNLSNTPGISRMTYYDILDMLIKNHLASLRQAIDKIFSILSKIKNNSKLSNDDIETLPSTYQSVVAIDLLTAKYATLIKDFQLMNDNLLLDEWNLIRDSLIYEKINWSKTDIKTNKSSEPKFINVDLINEYSPQIDLALYYLTKTLTTILNTNDKSNHNNIANLYVELINYVFELYNQDEINKIHDIKRFEYILNGSGYTVDLLKKGQGLIYKTSMEDAVEPEEPEVLDIEAKEEAEDVIEEAEALDVEEQYYEDNNEDYVDYGDE